MHRHENKYRTYKHQNRFAEKINIKALKEINKKEKLTRKNKQMSLLLFISQLRILMEKSKNWNPSQKTTEPSTQMVFTMFILLGSATNCYITKEEYKYHCP